MLNKIAELLEKLMKYHHDKNYGNFKFKENILIQDFITTSKADADEGTVRIVMDFIEALRKERLENERKNH